MHRVYRSDSWSLTRGYFGRRATTLSLAFGGLIGVVIGLSACVDSSASVQPVIPPRELPSQVTVTPDWVVATVGETVPLTLTAQNLVGEPMPVDSTVQWISSDTMTMTVDARGRMYARKATEPTAVPWVTARWTQKGATKEARAWINITQTRRPISGLHIVPVDSTRTGWGYDPNAFDQYTWVAIRTGTEDPMNPMDYFSLPLYTDGTSPLGHVVVANFGVLGMMFKQAPYALTSKIIGDYWLYTHASVYGTHMRDSVRLTGLYPYDGVIPFTRDSATKVILSRFINQDVIVQPCGEVRFINQLSTPFDIVFDDSTKATGCTPFDPSGNIENIGPGGTGGRKFSAVGTVRWTMRNRETGQLLPSVTGTITMKKP